MFSLALSFPAFHRICGDKGRGYLVSLNKPHRAHSRISTIRCFDYTFNYVARAKRGRLDAGDFIFGGVAQQGVSEGLPILRIKPKARKERGFATTVGVSSGQEIIDDFGLRHAGVLVVGEFHDGLVLFTMAIWSAYHLWRRPFCFWELRKR